VVAGGIRAANRHSLFTSLLPRPKRPRRKKEIVKSELTISAELIVKFIRKNVQPGNWTLFFHELSDAGGPSIPAMFEHARPQPHEIRPLDETIIEECKPQEMPEEPFEHLYACIAWFARWTQRAIPKAVWKQAVEQAKKTLVPKS
jgi:hypothetical protein